VRLVIVVISLLFCSLSTEASRRRPVERGEGAGAVGMLAFVSERDGNCEIYVINADGTGLLRLTDAPGFDGDPAWSPDGKRIAFASDRGGSSDRDIYVMDADGSNVVRRTDGGGNGYPAWSPDGKNIVFSSVRSGQLGLYIMSVDGDWANPRAVASHMKWTTQAAWSPDGQRIAFVSDYRAHDFLYDLYVMNADGTEIAPLLEGPWFGDVNALKLYFQPSWSPDGEKIAMVVCDDGWAICYPRSSIGIANADGSELKTLVQTGGYGRPTWSPDGSMIAFSTTACIGCTSELRYVSTDGGRRGVIFWNGRDAAWRPRTRVETGPQRAADQADR
jgi:Tol biopolymer transport system component